MRGDLLGGGVVVAVAAALWLIYLVPTWLHRREYLATERNAVRLQQTLRILAETAETPHEVRLEATAREVARQRKALKAAQRAADVRAQQAAEREAKAIAERQVRASVAATRVARAATIAADTAAAQAVADAASSRAAAAQSAAARAVSDAATSAPHPVEDAPSMDAAEAPVASAHQNVFPSAADVRRAARRRRRLRAAGSLLMLASLGVVGGGVVVILADGAWPLFAGGVAGFACSLIVLRRLARPVARATVSTVPVVPVESDIFDQAVHDAPQPVQEVSTWTPRPLPKPLHLSRGTVAASAMASVNAGVELRRAAARAELERRAITAVPELPRLRAVPVPSTKPTDQASAQGETPRAVRPEPQVAKATGTDGRYATMGVVDSASGARLDLDAVLRRRRG
jgi:Membrane protein involved in colicin uptake